MKQNKKETSIALKTMGIKSRVVNQFRKQFHDKSIDNFNEDQKLELFDQFFYSIKAAHNELRWYKEKRKYKAKIHAERVKRGYKFKTKTSKDESNHKASEPRKEEGRV